MANNAPPKHRVIYNQLREQIVAGDYAPGDRVPTEAELIKQFSTSRITVTRAVRDLANDGFLERRRGSGSYVLNTPGSERITLGFFAPFLESGESFPYVEGLIHQHLSNLAVENKASLLLQCLPKSKADRFERMLQAARSLMEHDVQGVLYYPSELPENEMGIHQEVVDIWTKAGAAVVLIDRDIVLQPASSQFTRIGYDNRSGGHQLTRHLIKSGCQRIAFVGIPESSTAVSDRLGGYFDALREQHISSDDALLRMVDEEQLTEEYCRSLIEEAKPDAIIGKSDRFAAIIGRHLMAMGKKIGQDIRLAGFDDDPIANLLPTPLTTVRLPIRPFAQAAFGAITRHIAGTGTDSCQIIIPTELVIRGSTDGTRV